MLVVNRQSLSTALMTSNEPMVQRMDRFSGWTQFDVVHTQVTERSRGTEVTILLNEFFAALHRSRGEITALRKASN